MSTRALLAGAVFVGLFTAHVPARASDFTFWLTGQSWAGVSQRYDDRLGRWVERPGTAFLITFEAGGRAHVLRGGDGPFGVITTTRWTESAGGVVVADVPGPGGAQDIELLLRAAQQNGTLEASSAVVVRAG